MCVVEFAAEDLEKMLLLQVLARVDTLIVVLVSLAGHVRHTLEHDSSAFRGLLPLRIERPLALRPTLAANAPC